MKLAALVILAASRAAAAHPQPAPMPVLPSYVRMIAVEAARAYQPKGWPPSAPTFQALLEAVLLVESSGCQHMHGIDSHAHGCMQIHEQTACEFLGFQVSPWMLGHDWDLNIRLAADMMRFYWNQTHSWQRMLSMYHQGQYYSGIDWPYVRSVESELHGG